MLNSANEGSIDLTAPPDQILIPSNYGEPTMGFPLSFQEVPQTNRFDATQQIAGGYGMLDLPLVQDRLRFVGGVRVEYSYIASNAMSPFGPANARINNLYPLPGVTFIYTPRPDMNVRYSVSETVSRPEFRELNPTLFIVSTGQRAFQGNQFLVESHIISNDLRWEWFFAPLDLASVSFFYKNLDKPIEIVALPATSENVDIPVNAASGTLWGFEIEFRKNYALLKEYAEDRRYVIVAAGVDHLPDIYQQPHNQLDAVWITQFAPFGTPLTGKFGVENILNDRYLQTQGNLVTNRYLGGVKFTFGVTYTY
jgi:outer membrane receptor protein involved in Fe transport